MAKFSKKSVTVPFRGPFLNQDVGTIGGNRHVPDPAIYPAVTHDINIGPNANVGKKIAQVNSPLQKKRQQGEEIQ